MKKNLKQAGIVLVITGILAAAALAAERLGESGQLTELERNTYGEGNRMEELEVMIEGEEKNRSVRVEIEERRYSEAELKEVFVRAVDQLDSLILGDNQSLNHIDQPLNLISEIPGESIGVEWIIDNYDILTAAGELRPENIVPEGNLIQLTATLTYGEEQVISIINAIIYPPINKEKQIQAGIQEVLREMNEQTKESNKYLLPSSLEGRKLIWKRAANGYSVIIILFGCAAAAYFLLIEKQNDQKQQKKKQEQMLLDYPEIINKLVLLLGAGMTVQKAWNRITLNYEEQIERTGIRYAYEEMLITRHELNSMLTESDSYERFGRRCNLTEFIKLGALLSQNLKKGVAGLTRMLALEAENAFSERKARARRKGEEAGTKLLLPMFLMLVVVLIIVIIPAFLTFQI